MTQQEIQERSEQIALMLGYVNTTPADKDFNIFEYPTKFGAIPKMIETMSMKFHSDWNWLMEARDFICNIIPKEYKKVQLAPYDVEIWSNRAKIEVHSQFYLVEYKEKDWPFGDFVEGNTTKEAVFIAVSDFAKLYNEGKL